MTIRSKRFPLRRTSWVFHSDTKFLCTTSRSETCSTIMARRSRQSNSKKSGLTQSSSLVMANSSERLSQCRMPCLLTPTRTLLKTSATHKRAHIKKWRTVTSGISRECQATLTWLFFQTMAWSPSCQNQGKYLARSASLPKQMRYKFRPMRFSSLPSTRHTLTTSSQSLHASEKFAQLHLTCPSQNKCSN